MPTSLSVAAVFATMDRAKTAEACVKALAQQTCLPKWVIIADNDSTDDTVAVLESLSDLPFHLIVHQMGENLGNAGGVKAVMELAFSLGADAVWILDDDSWPRPPCLAAMLEGAWNPGVVRHALQIDPLTLQFTWPLQIRSGTGGWQLVKNEAAMPDCAKVTSRISWTGALLPREVWKVVGPVNGELFIRGEDEEYPWRIEQAGFTQEAIRGALMDHPGPLSVIHWKLLGKSFFFEKGLADWKLYYKVRNMVWLKKLQRGKFHSILMASSYLVFAVVVDGVQRLPLLIRAILDGWHGRLGKM